MPSTVHASGCALGPVPSVHELYLFRQRGVADLNPATRLVHYRSDLLEVALSFCAPAQTFAPGRFRSGSVLLLMKI